MVIDTVKVGKWVLKAKQGITLETVTDETKQLICVTHADLSIDAFARMRNALVSELNEQIGMLWQEYALAEDAALDGMSVKMKQALLAAFSEIAHGAKTQRRGKKPDEKGVSKQRRRSPLREPSFRREFRPHPSE